jgi:hypothetical protein
MSRMMVNRRKRARMAWVFGLSEGAKESGKNEKWAGCLGQLPPACGFTLHIKKKKLALPAPALPRLHIPTMRVGILVVALLVSSLTHTAKQRAGEGWAGRIIASLPGGLT